MVELVKLLCQRLTCFHLEARKHITQSFIDFQLTVEQSANLYRFGFENVVYFE